MEIGSINAGFVNAVSDNAKAASNDITNKLKKDMSGADDTELMDVMSEYAAGAAKQSENGLAQMLYEQMKRNRGTVDPGQI